MSLHYLLDGYNLLYALRDIPAGSWEAKRESLLRLLTEKKPYGKNRVTVVFDSREGSGNRAQRGGLDIAFTAGETADEWISTHVRAAANPRIFVVITDDLGLRRQIRGTGAKVLGTAEFWKQSKAAPAKPSRQSNAIDADAITDELKKKWL